MSRITQIYQNGKENDKYDIGATFENVTYDYKNNNNEIKRFTLKDLYKYLKSFFNNGAFIKYSNSEPQDERIKIWYDVLYERDDSYYLDDVLTVEATENTLKKYVTGKDSTKWSSCEMIVEAAEQENSIDLLPAFTRQELRFFEIPSWQEIINELSLENENIEKIIIHFILSIVI